MGLALASVGLSIMASDFCQVGNYATVLKNYQLSYALGGLVSSAVPGMLADLDPEAIFRPISCFSFFPSPFFCLLFRYTGGMGAPCLTSQ